MSITHNFFKTGIQKRFSASDIYLWKMIAKILFDLIKDLFPLGSGHFHGLNITAAGSAVPAMFIATKRKLKEQLMQDRLFKELFMYLILNI